MGKRFGAESGKFSSSPDFVSSWTGNTSPGSKSFSSLFSVSSSLSSSISEDGDELVVSGFF